MKGVTQRTDNAFRGRMGYEPSDVRQINDVEVETIYREQYWNAVRADDLPPGLAYCVFDAAVNSGPPRAAKWLQSILGVKVDGVIGSNTLSAAQVSGVRSVIGAYCGKRLRFMKSLKHWSSFKNSWTRRVSEVRAQSLNWASGKAVPESRDTAAQAKADGPQKDYGLDQGRCERQGRARCRGWPSRHRRCDGKRRRACSAGCAAIMVLGAVGAVWWLVRGREA